MGWLLDAFRTGAVVDGARVDTALGYRATFAVAATMGLVALGCSVGTGGPRPGDPIGGKRKNEASSGGRPHR